MKDLVKSALKFVPPLWLCFVLVGCVREQPEIIIITEESSVMIIPPTDTVASTTTTDSTPFPTIIPVEPTYSLHSTMPLEHVVQAGDTLSYIAQQYNVTLNSLIEANQLINPDLLEVGQIINLPSIPSMTTPVLELMSDYRFIRGQESKRFNIEQFLNSNSGILRSISDIVNSRASNGAGFDERLEAWQIIERVSSEYSIDARLLIAILEYKTGWLSASGDYQSQMITHPIIRPEQSTGVNRSGLYRQLAYAANELNRGYYGWKGRGTRQIETFDNVRMLISAQNSPSTIAIQHLFAKISSYDQWIIDVGEQGFLMTYRRLFGDPLAEGHLSAVPNTLTQPNLILPFASGETWYYTGGHHGGWGSGSAWSSLDFAPPDERPLDGSFCYTSVAYVRAVADGVVAYNRDGSVMLDLDLDGDDTTGWVIVYLHVDSIVTEGMQLVAGDPIGFASCAGGFSNATHLHIGRKFNGEWIPADCSQCRQEFYTPPFIMSGWIVRGIIGQEYQGYMEKDGVQKQAEQGRISTINHISW